MNIIIADDHDLVREALATLIERDDPQAQVIQANSLQPAIQHIKTKQVFDVLLLDVHMPGMKDLSVIRTIIDEHPELPVVMMSGSINKATIKQCYDYGASGFIPKTMNGNALVSVLKMVISGVKYIPDMMLTNKPAEASKNQEELTERESQVLKLLLEGQSNKAIAVQLFIEATTVKMHLRSLFRKFAVSNRTELVVKAIRAQQSLP